MRQAQLQLLEDLRVTAGLPAPGAPDPLAQTVPVPTVDERLSNLADLITDVPGYLTVADTKTAMRNERLRLALAALAQVVATQGALLTSLTGRLDGSDAKFVVQAAQLQLSQAAYQQLLTSQQAEEARLSLVEAKATLTASATEANRLDIVALKAADVLLQARATGNEAAITAAQATATQARAEAATAQAKADADATAALQAKAAADAAQATASQALAAQQAQAARWRTARVASPAIAIGATATLAVSWSPPFADAAYSVVAECEGTALLGLEATVTARTATGCTVQIKNSLGLALALNAGTISLIATHD